MATITGELIIVVRVLIDLLHAVRGMAEHQLGIPRHFHGHQAGLSSDVQPRKHERTQDKAPPVRYKRLIFS